MSVEYHKRILNHCIDMTRIRPSVLNNILLMFIFLSMFSCAEKNHQKVNELLQLSQKSFDDYDDIKAFKYALQAKNISERGKSSEDKAKTYYQLSYVLSQLGLQKESIHYIAKTYEQSYTSKNRLLQAKLKSVKSYNYYTAELYSQDIKELFGALQLIKKNTDRESRIAKAQFYREIGGYYENTKENFDSAKIYYKLTEIEFTTIPERFVYHDLSNFYIRLGTLKIKENDNPETSREVSQKNYETALAYYKKALAISQKYKVKSLQTEYQALGDYYYSTDQYPQALEFYLKSIKEKQPSADPYALRTYRNISELYKLLGDSEHSAVYQKIFDKKISDSDSRNSKNMDFIVKSILKDQQNENESVQRQKYIWLALMMICLLLAFILIYNILRKKLRVRESQINRVTHTLQERDEIILQKNIETKELKLKVNDAYNELVALAQNNDPSFYFRFQEVYPELQIKLSEDFPGLRTTEFTLCAYTYLGFNVKDIADYTFKSVNTIRNRKQNLRKKFNIPTDQDMGIWLRDLIKNDLKS